MEPILPRYIKREPLKAPNPPSEYDMGGGSCGPPVVETVHTVQQWYDEEMMALGRREGVRGSPPTRREDLRGLHRLMYYVVRQLCPGDAGMPGCREASPLAGNFLFRSLRVRSFSTELKRNCRTD